MRALVPAVLLAALLQGSPATAQDPGPYDPVRRDPLGTILINGPTPYTLGSRRLEVLFTHRFQQPVNEGGNSHNLWGLDSGADIGLGLAWGATPHLDLSVYRVSFQEDFEFAGKLLVFEQAPRVPLTVAVRAGLDYLRRPGVEDPNRPFAQLLLARKLAPGVNLLVSPSPVPGQVADRDRVHPGQPGPRRKPRRLARRPLQVGGGPHFRDRGRQFARHHGRPDAGRRLRRRLPKARYPPRLQHHSRLQLLRSASEGGSSPCRADRRSGSSRS